MVYDITTLKYQNEYLVKKDENPIYIIKNVGNGYTIYDYLYHHDIEKYKFYKHTGTDYINHAVTKEFKLSYPNYNSSHIYLHSFIMKYCAKVHNPENKPQIDHINRNKFDNRLCNLRWATTSEQNQNKFVRADKKLPCEELVSAGINELPRYIRFDKSQERFVIDNHPKLVEQVDLGLIKKPQKNGTRKGSIFQKLYDAVTIAISFENNNNQCEQYNELETISQVFNETFGENPMKILKPDSAYYEYKETMSKLEKIMENNSETKVLKKGLPENCGITADMIPKYCYFQPESTTRGCKFVIDKHPNLEKRQWSTTSAKGVSILAKFELLQEKLKEIMFKPQS